VEGPAVLSLVLTHPQKQFDDQTMGLFVAKHRQGINTRGAECGYVTGKALCSIANISFRTLSKHRTRRYCRAVPPRLHLPGTEKSADSQSQNLVGP